MPEIRDVVAALHSVANYGGDEQARAEVQAYLDDTAEPVEAEPVDYTVFSAAELRDELQRRELPKDGTKAELAERLAADDARNEKG